MKKSKLLRSSKEMLSRSFNPTKCKTSLRLASARLKLLKNKKEVQVKQMRKEIAQLLESGQERTARMRVEHVIREEKMVAAFDLLEIYCELTIARLPVIESQKNCPNDLKEAIASVIFASLRCGDVPELLDVRKQLTAKYGKEFATAAVELRPQSGVSHILVEKLSATAPAVETKTKILSAIAEEHNVKWEHEVLEEKDSIPSSGVSEGASYYGMESKPYVEQPRFEAADSQAHPNTNQMHSQSTSILQHDPRISMQAEKVTTTQPAVVGTAYQPEARPQGDNNQGDSNASSPIRHKWNMEFKDATSAAQAAVESAEMASMAAKAAAELSMQNRIMRQEPTESHASDDHISKDEWPYTHSIPRISQEQFPKETMKEEFSSAQTGSHNEKIDKIDPYNHKTSARFKEDNGGSPEEYTQPASLNSKSSTIDDAVNYGVPVKDHYSQKNPMEEVSRVETSTNQQTFKHEEETAKDWARKTESHQKKKIEKQQSVSPSRSHSSLSDDVNIFANSEDAKYESDTGENPFVDIAEGGTHEGETSHQTSSHEEASVFYDKFDSETDDHGFDLRPKYDKHYSGLDLSSASEKYPEHPSLNTYSWNPRSQLAQPVDPAPPLFFARQNSPPIFSGNLLSRDNEEVDNFAPITYDDSDGPSSDIEEDMNAGHYKMEDSRSYLSEVNRKESSTLSFEDINRHSVGSPPLGQSEIRRKQPSMSSDSDIEDMGDTKSEVKNFDAGSPVRSSLGKLSPRKPNLGHKEPPQELRENGHESSSGGEEGLPFGKLTGGLRHKGGNTLTFLKKQVDASSSIRDTENTVGTSMTSAKPYSVEPPKESSMLYKKKNTLDLHTESDSDSSEDDGFLKRPSGHKLGTYTHTNAETKLSLGASNSTFGSDSSDLDDNPPKESLARKSHLHSGISRRTRPTPASSRTSSHSKMHLRSEANDIDEELVRKPVTSYNSETQKMFESKRNSGKWENSEQPASAKVTSKPAKSSLWGPPEPVKTTSTSKQESKTGLRSELQDAPAYHLGETSLQSYSPYTQQTVQSFNRNSNELENSDHPTSGKMVSKPTTSSLLGTSDKPNSGKATSTAMQKPMKPTQKSGGYFSSEGSKSETLNKNSSKITQKSSTVEEPLKAPQKLEASFSSEGSKSDTSNKISSTRNESPKKASHVHPKLPDYDTLFQSLRANRS